MEIEPETWQGDDMAYRFVVFSISIELLAAAVSCTSINVGNDDLVIYLASLLPIDLKLES